VTGVADARLAAISPFFISGDVARAIAFYRDRLGFEVRFAEPADAPFLAIVGRDSVQVFLKAAGEIAAVPNRTRDADLRWDAFVSVEDPDTLAEELIGRGLAFASSLQDTHDGLRGFEIDDADGYRLFFGCPR
jgi:catechol 2,3-dioxygenase-like lactoylglutathione lyase family enzyme